MRVDAEWDARAASVVQVAYGPRLAGGRFQAPAVLGAQETRRCQTTAVNERRRGHLNLKNACGAQPSSMWEKGWRGRSPIQENGDRCFRWCQVTIKNPLSAGGGFVAAGAPTELWRHLIGVLSRSWTQPGLMSSSVVSTSTKAAYSRVSWHAGAESD